MKDTTNTEIFTTVKLSNGDKAEIKRYKAMHAFEIMLMAGTTYDLIKLTKCTYLTLTLINGEVMENDYLEKLDICDVALIGEAINCQTAITKG